MPSDGKLDDGDARLPFLRRKRLAGRISHGRDFEIGTAWRSTPVPLPWMITTEGRRMRKARSKNRSTSKMACRPSCPAHPLVEPPAGAVGAWVRTEPFAPFFFGALLRPVAVLLRLCRVSCDARRQLDGARGPAWRLRCSACR